MDMRLSSESDAYCMATMPESKSEDNVSDERCCFSAVGVVGVVGEEFGEELDEEEEVDDDNKDWRQPNCFNI